MPGRSPGRKTATAPHEPRRPAACTPANPGTAVSEPDSDYARRFASPQVTRTCAFCASKRPLPELAPWGMAMACTDLQACSQRAEAAALYPQDESELRIAAIEGRQGAVT